MEDNDIVSRIETKLELIQDKLNTSSALNGAFEVLVSDDQQIKDSQQEVKETISSIKKSVYNPDNGLFSRVKEVERKVELGQEFDLDVKDVVERHREMSLWALAAQKQMEKWEDQAPELLIEIDRLSQWKNNVTKLLWILVTVVSSLVLKTLFSMVVSI